MEKSKLGRLEQVSSYDKVVVVVRGGQIKGQVIGRLSPGVHGEPLQSLIACAGFWVLAGSSTMIPVRPYRITVF